MGHMVRKRFVLPDLRDLFHAGYEVIGNFVVGFLSSTSRSKRILYSLLVGGMAALVGVAAQSGHPVLGTLCVSIFPAGVIWVRALDIARVRQYLFGIPEQKRWQEPDLPQRLIERSPTIEALWTVARCLTLLRQGWASSVESTADDVDRAMLDRRTIRLLDATRAMAAFELGEQKQAVRLAALAVPVEVPAIDRAVGRILLSGAWHDVERLAVLKMRWREMPGVLAELAMLVELRSMSTTARVETLATLDADLIERISDDARAIGDLPLSEVLIQPARHLGPYR
jgi:hypothetical protein